jgi:hypothetical protein
MDSFYVLLSAVVIALTLGAWTYSFTVYRKTGREGMYVFLGNFVIFLLYNASLWKAIMEAHNWDAFAYYFLWIILTLVHSIVFFFVSLIKKKRASASKANP